MENDAEQTDFSGEPPATYVVVNNKTEFLAAVAEAVVAEAEAEADVVVVDAAAEDDDSGDDEASEDDEEVAKEDDGGNAKAECAASYVLAR